MKPFVFTFCALLMAGFALSTTQSQIAPKVFQLASPDFGQGGQFPKRFTCDDQNISPTLQIAGVPEGAKSLVLILDDPDAPSGTWTHWLMWNMSPDLREIVAGAAPRASAQGTNDFGKPGYGGPCPPSGEHRYYFRLYALDTPLNLPTTAKRAALDKAIKGHVLGQATLMGKYSRVGTAR
jgi:Raf kinase inhibitor-like YbhB/YbcL family protein